MANYNKSFNFRNGVQVDDDNFIVNANGLVGIGTSIPREFLDVHGTAKVAGLVTARNLAVTGVSTFYSDVKVGSGITMYSSTGIVSATAFYGDGSNLLNVEQIAVDGWIVNAGNLSTTSKVGIGTTLPYYSLQIGLDPLTGNGLSIDAITGNVNTTGIVTAASRFSGNLTGNITGNINSTGVSTFATLKVGTGVTISGGIVTATSFVGPLTGTATTTTNIPNLTGAITSSNTTTSLGSFTSAQLATALTDETGSGVNVFATSPTLITPVLGSATATSIVVGSGVTINSGGITVSAGIITAFGFSGTLTGNIVGIASTARDLTSDARVSIAHIASQTSSIGISTVSTRLYAESIGVGTNSPSGDIHIRRSSTSTLQVTSDTAEAIVAIGRSTNLTGSNGALIFGNTSGLYPYSLGGNSLDIVNYSTGNINNYLQLNSSGTTGSYNWFHGQSPTNLMTLTYQGRLGLGVTLPTNTIHVSGTSTVSGNSYVGGNFYAGNNVIVGADLTVSGNLNLLTNITGNLIGNVTGNLTGNVNSTGVSTFNDILINNNIIVDNSIGIGTTSPRSSLDILGSGAIFGYVGIGTTNTSNQLTVVGNSEFYGNVGIGTSIATSKLHVVGDARISGVTTSQNGFTSGIGVTNPVKITVSGSILTFTVVGVGSTSLTLF